MNRRITEIKIKVTTWALLCLPLLIFGQNNSKKQVEQVFNKLVFAYGSSKATPKLVYFQGDVKTTTPALYTTITSPTIKFDLKFYELCRTLGKDSLNAASVVLGHELAHYYNDHTFCSDFAFAVRNQSKELSGKLKLTSKTEKMSLETQADHKGLFYAAMAGFEPFEIQPKLLDVIYKHYNLAENNPGYPSKAERKQIAQLAWEKSKTLFENFKKGIAALETQKYTEAITIFETLNQTFPSRENYNNLGVAKVLEVLRQKPLTVEESKYPERFVYPIQYDTTSRLTNKETTRGLNDEQIEAMEQLLKSAQKDFEKAISLDPAYTTSYINLACVYELLGNPNAAIGKIKELPKTEQEKPEALRILAIAYYYDGNIKKAEEIWKEQKI